MTSLLGVCFPPNGGRDSPRRVEQRGHGAQRAPGQAQPADPWAAEDLARQRRDGAQADEDGRWP